MQTPPDLCLPPRRDRSPRSSWSHVVYIAAASASRQLPCLPAPPLRLAKQPKEEIIPEIDPWRLATLPDSQMLRFSVKFDEIMLGICDQSLPPYSPLYVGTKMGSLYDLVSSMSKVEIFATPQLEHTIVSVHVHRTRRRQMYYKRECVICANILSK